MAVRNIVNACKLSQNSKTEEVVTKIKDNFKLNTDVQKFMNNMKEAYYKHTGDLIKSNENEAGSNSIM